MVITDPAQFSPLSGADQEEKQRQACGRARRSQRTRLVGIRLARDRTRCEASFGVGEDRAYEATALRSGGADDGDGLLVGHV